MKTVNYYEILKDVGAFSGLAWLVRTAWKAFQNRLSQRERELLTAALTTENHFVSFCNYPNAGRIWVQAGKLDLGDSRVPDAEFVDALESLLRRGYLRRSEDDLFVLTGSGLKVAKSVAATIKVEQIPSKQNDGNKGLKRSLSGPGAMVG